MNYRYLRAFEVGRNPSSVKYEMHVRFRSLKNGPVVRNRLRLPHPVKTDLKICVIAPPDSKAAEDARAAGASLVGEDAVFDQIREGIIDFDRCICHIDSLQKLNKSGLGRVLGPRGLMPSTKAGTVVSQIGSTVRDMVGASEYRERMGVVRVAIGQLGFTPTQMQTNIKIFMDMIKKDTAQMSDRINKEIHEVVSPICSDDDARKLTFHTGTQFYQWPRVHAERRVQRSRLDRPRAVVRSFVNVYLAVQKLYHITVCFATIKRLRYAGYRAPILPIDFLRQGYGFNDLSTLTASADSSISA